MMNSVTMSISALLFPDHAMSLASMSAVLGREDGCSGEGSFHGGFASIRKPAV
jgi:hypothetical protein